MRCPNPKTVYPHRSIEWLDAGNEEKPIQVPCGKCVACRTNQRTDWSFRLQQEHKASKTAYFVTLTYDEKHIPSDNGLRKVDLQNFMKRLRQRDGTNKIRFFGVGEYGSKSGRAHYHILLFNARESDIRPSWQDSKGQPIGLVHVGRVTVASVAYCCKYIIEGEQGEIRELPNEDGKKSRTRYLPDGRLAPFRLMSRRYGIGGHYLTDEMVQWHRDNDANYTVLPGNEKSRLPRFYKDKIWHRPKDRERIASAAIKLSQEQEEKELKYYRDNYGDRAEAVRAEFQMRAFARVKSKVRYTQTI